MGTGGQGEDRASDQTPGPRLAGTQQVLGRGCPSAPFAAQSANSTCSTPGSVLGTHRSTKQTDQPPSPHPWSQPRGEPAPAGGARLAVRNRRGTRHWASRAVKTCLWREHEPSQRAASRSGPRPPPLASRRSRGVTVSSWAPGKLGTGSRWFAPPCSGQGSGSEHPLGCLPPASGRVLASLPCAQHMPRGSRLTVNQGSYAPRDAVQGGRSQWHHELGAPNPLKRRPLGCEAACGVRVGEEEVLLGAWEPRATRNGHARPVPMAVSRPTPPPREAAGGRGRSARSSLCPGRSWLSATTRSAPRGRLFVSLFPFFLLKGGCWEQFR